MTTDRLVIFDVDGTLIDSQHLILAAMDYAFATAGHPRPEREVLLGVVGLSLPVAMATLAPHLPEAQALVLADHYRDSFVTQRQTTGGEAAAPLYPGARAALDRLAATGARLGVATGKARRGLDHVLAGHGFETAFATLQTADHHPSKPHPAMVLAALAETGVDPARATMVGDTEFDIAMGRAAGVATVGVTWGYHPRARLEAAGADAIIDSFDDLDAALARLADRTR